MYSRLKYGVKFFFQRLMVKERDIRDLKGIKISAVGSKTASAIKKYGIKVDLVPEKFNAEGLIDAFIQQSNAGAKSGSPLQGVKILLPRAEVARELFPQKARELGGEVDVFTSYKVVKPEVHGKRMKRFLMLSNSMNYSAPLEFTTR